MNNMKVETVTCNIVPTLFHISVILFMKAVNSQHFGLIESKIPCQQNYIQFAFK